MTELYKIVLIYILLILVDSVYILFVKNIFDNQIKLVQGSPMKIDKLAFIICYLFITFGLYYFIIKEKKSIKDAFLLGISIYGVYELTNKAILNNWQWNTVLIDTVWGGVLFSIVSSIMYKFN